MQTANAHILQQMIGYGLDNYKGLNQWECKQVSSITSQQSEESVFIVISLMVFIAFNSHKRAQSYAYRNKGKTNKKRREWHNLLLTILIISFVAFLSYKQNRIGYVRMEYLRERMNRQRFYTKSELCILTVYDISCIFHSEVKAHSLKNLVKV